jgi:hypothetical protein
VVRWDDCSKHNFRNVVYAYKNKGNFVPMLKHYAMKAYGGVDVQIHVLLTFALVGGKWSASCACRFNPGERSPSTHLLGGWVGPRAGLGGMKKRKFLTLPGFELRSLVHPVRSQSLYRLLRPISHISQTMTISNMISAQFTLKTLQNSWSNAFCFEMKGFIVDKFVLNSIYGPS